jgi:hypothetical protein
MEDSIGCCISRLTQGWFMSGAFLLVLAALGLLRLAGSLDKNSRLAPDGVELAAEWRWVCVTRMVFLLIGLAAAAVTVQWGSEEDRGQALAAVAFGLCVLVGAAVSETVVRPRPPTGVRWASLRPRRVRDYLPRRMSWIVMGQLLAMVVTIVVTTLTASDNDQGRRVAVSCVSPTAAATTEPYPGSFYTLPLAGGMIVVLLVAALAARQAVCRPRGMAMTEAGEDRLRRRSLEAIVAATGIAIGVSLLWVSDTAASELRFLATETQECAPAWMNPVGLVFHVVTLSAVVTSFYLLLRVSGVSRHR